MYNCICNQHFICLTDTYLDFSTPNNLTDKKGYNLFCTVHPNNIKRGGIYIYSKESLPDKFISLP